MTAAELKPFIEKVEGLIKSHPVFVASKSYCPYCAATKKRLSKLKANAFVIELDHEKDGSELQDALQEITNQRTVPNIFIGGKHIGGNSDLSALSDEELAELFKKANAKL